MPQEKDYFSQFPDVGEDYFSQFPTLEESNVPETKKDEGPSSLRKAWDWANTSLLKGTAIDPKGELTYPTPEEFQTQGMHAVNRAIGSAITSPLGIAGEFVGGIGALRGLRNIKNRPKAPVPTQKQLPAGTMEVTPSGTVRGSRNVRSIRTQLGSKTDPIDINMNRIGDIYQPGKTINEPLGTGKLPQGVQLTEKPRISASEASQYMDAVKTGAIPKGTTFEQFKRNEHNISESIKKLLTDEAGELRLPTKVPIPKGIDEKTFKNVHREVVNALRSGNLIDLNGIRTRAKIGNREFNKIVDSIIKSGTLSSNIKKATEASENIAVVKLLRALDVSKPLRQQQEQIYSQIRSERIGKFQSSFREGTGAEGFKKGMSQLSGEMPKINPVTLTGVETDELFNMISRARITPFEKVRAGTALNKLLEGTAIPQRNELGLLDKVYGQGFSERIIEMHGGIGAVGLKLTKTANTMKSMNATFDASAPLRQGIGLIHRKEYWNAWKEMYGYMNESKFKALNKYLEERPTYLLGRENGLFLAGEELAQREEQFLTSYLGDLSKLLDKNPSTTIAGKVGTAIPRGLVGATKVSERMYVGFLNKLRADTFDNLLRDAVAAGHNAKDIAPHIAKYVNQSTGRGDLGRAAKMGEELNAIFFSPRLIASRLSILNPKYYYDAPQFVRMEALKTLGAIASFTTLANGLGLAANGNITLDPRNSDFGKIKFGNTRVDPGAGFSQYITAAVRALSGQSISPTSVNLTNLGKDYGTSRWDPLVTFGKNKLSPAASLIDVMFTGEDFLGQPADRKKEIRNRFTPIILQDIEKLAQDDPTWAKIALTIPALHGMGLQTFQPRTSSLGTPSMRPPSLDLSLNP